MNKKSEIKKRFRQIIIGDLLKTLRSVFQVSNENSYRLYFNPPYQRNYVWSIVKATYFIETILIHGEIPPFVIYQKEGIWEVIDGKQRAETIARFLNNQFALKGQGLMELWNLAGRKFSDLDENLQERILNTILRFIIIRPNNENQMSGYSEELVKREIFKRHNMAIASLKREEIDKAEYLQDEIDIHFKNQFSKVRKIYDQVSDIFDHRNKSFERMMQLIRQLLVLPNIPINRFALEKEDIVNQYYDYLSYATAKSNEKKSLHSIFLEFMKKIDILTDLKSAISKRSIPATRLLYEAIFWAISVCEKEGIVVDKIRSDAFKSKLIIYLEKRQDKFSFEKNHYSGRIYERYRLIADFFQSQLKISFAGYLDGGKEFLVAHKALMRDYLNERYKPGLEQEYFSKPFPTSYTVTDILDMIKRGKFNIRPPYQRNEVMSKLKASLLIESMLLGIKLQPIYVFVRQNGISEVIDGQQRLLAIIAFLGHEFRNQDGQMEFSKKNKFSLSLQDGLFSEYDKLKFEQLPEDLKKYLHNYTIHIIEIKEENNKNFKPEALFKRLNYKPCPIKENTFEYWNSYIDLDITNEIRAIQKRNNWLYLRKTDVRMLNEELVTCLSYLHYMSLVPVPDLDTTKQIINIYTGHSGVAIRIKNKQFITRLLENSGFKEEYLKSLISFETNFLEKIKILISTQSSDTLKSASNRRLDSILQTKGIRFSASFILLWLILLGIPIEHVRNSKTSVLNSIRKIFQLSRKRIKSENFETAIIETWIKPLG